MSHYRRFYAPVDLLEKSEIAVDGEEARHALKVLRIKVGEKVSIINGKGEEVSGIIEKADKERLLIKATDKVKFHSPLSPKISLLIGMSEINALEEALLHCTELGLWKFCPVFTKYSVTKPEQIEKKIERFQKIAISAIKQSGFPFLPEILIFRKVEEAIQTLPPNGFLFSQDGEKRLDEFVELPEEVTFAIGPEGDFSEEEKKLFLEHNYKKAKLSNYTLRVETAAITALAQAKKY